MEGVRSMAAGLMLLISLCAFSSAKFSNNNNDRGIYFGSGTNHRHRNNFYHYYGEVSNTDRPIRELRVSVSPPGPLHVDVGREAVLQCRIEGDSSARLEWSKVGGALPFRASNRRDGYLIINPVRPEDQGTYMCTATATVTKEAVIELYVDGAAKSAAQKRYRDDAFEAPPAAYRCGPDEATCRNGECIKREELCDGDFDCRDRSDEVSCGTSSGNSRICEPNEFRCDNGRCVQKMWICDSEDDCGDRSDEKNCGSKAPGEACAPWEYKCQTRGQCIPRSYHCDGQNDCQDGSDEFGCAPPTVVEPPSREIRVCRGATIVVNCRATGGPMPHISWRLNWGAVCDPPRCTQTSANGYGTLTILDATDLDQGAYSCEAINVKGRVLATPDAIVTVSSCQADHQCHIDGSLETGRGGCRCKLYTTGITCDQCASNTFHMARVNPHGCIPCFCMGVTKVCQSSNYYRTQERLSFVYDNSGVTLVDVHGRDVGQPANDVTRLRGYLTTDAVRPAETVYWKLPEKFTGNKLTAYGGKLKFLIQYGGGGTQNTEPLVILKGNEITVVHQGPKKINPGEPVEIIIDMFETSWKRDDGQGVTREHFLMTLANIDSFLIKSSHCNDQISSSLGDIVWDLAVPTDTQQLQALAVEQCACPPEYKGLSCESCADGYVRSGGGLYLGTCVRSGDVSSQCNIDGSSSLTPDPTGQCPCKEYAMGRNCDQCKPNAFHLSRSNPSGCIPCFCSGVTRDCDSSNFYRSTVRISLDQSITSELALRTSEASGFHTSRARPSFDGRKLSVNDFQDVPQGKSLYMELPRQFLGNKITSYGGVIKIVVHCTGEGEQDKRPFLIIRGNDINLLYKPEFTMEPGTDATFSAEMFENNWTREDGLMSTREHLLMTLADLNTILVRVTCCERTTQFSLLDVSMDIAEPQQVSHERANAVEQCRCPAGYIGTSCEDCASGFTRTGGGLYLGLCERCQCNGHADSCDPEFGDCIDCRHNTYGPNCQFCVAPFVGDPTRGTPEDCKSQAVGCSNCQCYNHSPRGCDANCRCIDCEHNTQGNDCGHCIRGYYGDARRGTPHDCQPCNCPGGADCTVDRAGRPVCRGGCPPGYRGPHCTECDEGYAPDPHEPGRCRPIGAPPLSVRVDPERQEVDEGASTSFRCTSQNSDARLSWYGPNNNLPAGSYERNGELLLYQLNQAHTGTYKCLALFPNGQTATAFGQLSVRPRSEPFSVRIHEPKYVQIEEGQPLTMRCEVVGRPREPVRLMWSKVGSESLPRHATESQGILNFYDLRSDDSGNYQCIGTTPSGQSDQDDATLVVQPKTQPPLHGEPLQVRILEPKQVQVEDGETVRFTCEAVNRHSENPRLTWSKSGQVGLPPEAQEDNGALIVYNVHQEDAGTYKCTGVVPGQEAHDEAMVSVKPKVTAVPFKVRIRDPKEKRTPEGSSAGFYCEVVKPYQKRFTLAWSRPDHPSLPQGSTSQDGQLNLFHINGDFAGRYVCTGTSADGEIASDEANLIVESGGLAPLPSLTPEVQTVRPGDPVEIICTSGGDPPPIIQWGFNGAANPLRAGIDQEDGRLRIPSAELSDAGDYHCTASNIHGTLSVQATVHVETRPIRPIVHIEPTHEKKLEPGENFEFICTATGSQPIQLSWFEEQRGPMSPNMKDDGNGKLQILGARPENEGRFVCIATNTAGEADDTVQVTLGHGDLTVKIVPGGDELGIVEVSHEDPLNLECVAEVSPGLPDPKVEWIFDIGPSRGDVPDGFKAVETHGRFVTHNAVTEHNEGKYTCKASSGNITKEVSVQVNVLPRPKRDVIIIGSSERTIAPGDNLVLTCMLSDPGASGSLRWSLMDVDSGRSSAPPRGVADPSAGTLRIDKVGVADSGVYECQHFDEDEGHVLGASRVSVAVRAPGAGERSSGGSKEGQPREVTVDGGAVQVAEVNEDFQLKCSSSGDDAEAELKWFHQGKGNAEVLARGEVRAGTLSLKNIRARDAGVYTCAQYVNGVRGSEYQVTVIVSFTEKDAVRKSVPVGGDTEIECPVHAVTGMSYAWVRLRDALPAKFTTDRHLLKLHDFQPGDAGVYECEAWINDNNALGYVNLVTQDVDHVQLFMEVNPDYVVLGNDVTFKCIVEGDNAATIRWEKGDGELPTNSEVTADSFTIFNVKKEDTGVYNCVASTTAGSMTTKAVLQIGKPIPRFDRTGFIRVEPPEEKLENFLAKISFNASDLTGILFCLFWSPKKHKSGHFVVLAMQDGLPMLKIKNGNHSSVLLMNHQNRLITNQWYTLVIEKRSNKILLSIEDEIPAEKIIRHLDIRGDVKIFIGGHPVLRQMQDDWIPMQGFLGLISQFEFNGRTYDFNPKNTISSKIEEFVDVCHHKFCMNDGQCLSAYEKHGYKCQCHNGFHGEHCQKSGNSCGHGRCHNNGSCILMDRNEPNSFQCLCKANYSGVLCDQSTVLLGPLLFDGDFSFVTLKKPFGTMWTFNVQLSIKPMSLSDGLILYVAKNHQMPDDYFGLILKDEFIELHAKLGSGTALIQSRQKIEAEHWYTIKVERSLEKLDLLVNSVSDSSLISPLGKMDFHAGTEIFIGGVYPNTTLPQGIGTKVSFHGCIDRNALINNMSYNLVSDSRDSANIDDCHTGQNPCDDQTCMHPKAVCLVNFAREEMFECLCPAGTKGHFCEETDSVRSLEMTTEYLTTTGLSTDATQNASSTDSLARLDQPSSDNEVVENLEECQSLINPCGDNGLCTLVHGKTSCKCKIGFMGELCEQFVSIEHEALFEGNGYAKFNRSLIRRDDSYTDLLTLEIIVKTNSSAGLVFWHKRSMEGSRPDQYTALAINRGFTELSFSLGENPAQLFSRRRIDDNVEHTVRVRRNHELGEIIFDNDDPIMGQVSPQRRTSSWKDEDIYIGGTPNGDEITGGLYKQNFQGCLSYVRLDGNLVDFMLDNISGENIKPCPSTKFTFS